MFSGIVEQLGKIVGIEKEGTNITFNVESALAKDAYIDQSISHNGVCLTVIEKTDTTYKVTAILETLEISNLRQIEINEIVNLERAMLPNTRMDGHMVQGHVDCTFKCVAIDEKDGSWYFSFALDEASKALIVSKGSIAINGVSLTVVEPDDETFKVAIIPYTYEHTNFKTLKPGDLVNIEFDIIGKYVAKSLKHYL